MEYKAVKKAVASCGGKLILGIGGSIKNGKGEIVEGMQYDYEAVYDDEDDIDSFVEENYNDVTDSYIDFENGTLTHWFNLKG